MSPSRASSPDSLFEGRADDEVDSIFGDDGDSDGDSLLADDRLRPAQSTCPAVPGLYVFPTLLDAAIAEDTLDALAIHSTFSETRNQCMLFTRPPPHPSSLPSYLCSLEAHLSSVLRPLLPPAIHAAAFGPREALARQMILNTYRPGEGISSHVDLVGRYADGIVGVCLEGGAVMRFKHVDADEEHDVWLPARTVYVMCGQARWEWEHGIDGREDDVVDFDGSTRTIARTQRTSVTMRWMKRGADQLR